MSDEEKIKQILEGLLLAAGKPLTLERLAQIFNEDERPENSVLKAALQTIEEECEGRGFELKKVASGYRFQVRQELGDWISRLWEEKPQRYSRALLETLSIIAYRQPITRGDIEKIRGVAVSSSIVRTLLDREWVRVVGHRDVPGRPAMYASTRQFLDYFNLESLEQLPALTEIRDLEELDKELPLEEEGAPSSRLIEYPAELDDDDEVVVMDEEEAAAAAVGTRPINEILGIVEEEEDDAEQDDLEFEDEPEGNKEETESQ
jgi:segregation and condensation protein B